MTTQTKTNVQTNLAQRNGVLNEIVQSEQQYISFLQALKEVYDIPLLENSKKSEGALISAEDHKLIFGNLGEIRSIHEKLYHDLERHLKQTGTRGMKIDNTLGAIFLTHAPSFLYYTKYCNQFANVAQRLRDLRQLNKELDNWLAQQKRKCKAAQNNSLDSFRK